MQPWFAVALESPRNAKRTAAFVRMQHKQGQMTPLEYMAPYLSLMFHVLTHTELELFSDLPCPDVDDRLNDEEMGAMDLCPLGTGTELVNNLSAALTRRNVLGREMHPEEPQALHHSLYQHSPQACSGSREAHALRRMLSSCPAGLGAQAVLRRSGSGSRRGFRAHAQIPAPRVVRAALTHVVRSVSNATAAEIWWKRYADLSRHP